MAANQLTCPRCGLWSGTRLHLKTKHLPVCTGVTVACELPDVCSIDENLSCILPSPIMLRQQCKQKSPRTSPCERSPAAHLEMDDMPLLEPRTHQPPLHPAELLLAKHLPVSALQAVLSAFASGGAYVPSTTNAQELLQNIEARSNRQCFATVDLSGELDRLFLRHNQEPCRERINIALKADLVQSITDLVRDAPEGSVALYPEDEYDAKGRRLISEFKHGSLWPTVIQKTAETYPILWVLLWSDKGNLDKPGKSSGHPVTACVLNTPLSYQRSAEGCCTLAMLPQVPLPPGMPHAKAKPCFVTAQCICS